MNTSNDKPGEGAVARDPANGVASAKHQGLHRPNDDQRVEQALDDVGLEDRGDVVEDQWRDRRSRGGPPQEESSAGDIASGGRAGERDDER